MPFHLRRATDIKKPTLRFDFNHVRIALIKEANELVSAMTVECSGHCLTDFSPLSCSSDVLYMCGKKRLKRKERKGNNEFFKKKTNEKKGWQGCRESNPATSCWGECELAQSARVELPSGPAPRLGHTHASGHCSTAGTWDQPRCPFIIEWM